MISHNEKCYANELNNMILIQLSNTPFKNRLPVTLTVAIVYLLINLFTVLRISLLNKWQKIKFYGELKVEHYCSTISLKTVLLVPGMDKES